jgi:hypothetical protein
MGNFRITIDAVGGHGCQRELKDGAVVGGCGLKTCPDCLARWFVRALEYVANSSVKAATLTHWPEGPGTVVDDLLTGHRTGSF